MLSACNKWRIPRHVLFLFRHTGYMSSQMKRCCLTIRICIFAYAFAPVYAAWKSCPLLRGYCQKRCGFPSSLLLSGNRTAQTFLHLRIAEHRCEIRASPSACGHERNEKKAKAQRRNLDLDHLPSAISLATRATRALGTPIRSACRKRSLSSAAVVALSPGKRDLARSQCNTSERRLRVLRDRHVGARCGIVLLFYYFIFS